MKDMACQAENTKRLGVALGITLLFFSLELIGGILTNSLALLTDAWHMLNDVIGLAFSIGASFVALKPATIKKTYGYYRIEIIAGFLNGIFLWAIVAFIILEAVQRIQQPQHVDSLSVFIIALLGLAANGLSAIVLSKSSRSSLNVKGAFLHVLSDLLGSLGVILAAVIMLLTGWYQADAVVSIFVGVLVFYGSGRLVFESLNILLEGVPGDVDISSLEKRISGIDGVKSVHDLHVWCIAPNRTCCLSCHIVVEEKADRKMLLSKLINMLKKEFGIDHTTFQFEEEGYPKASNEH
jgi:cobalt-zinc-cadmium efflux system protein